MTAAAPARGEAPRALLSPERPQLAAARAVVDGRICGACVSGIDGRGRVGPLDGTGRCVRCRDTRRVDVIESAAEAWEALATRGVIPDAWVGDERRAFECVCERGWLYDTGSGHRIGRPCNACDFLVALPHPPTIAACVALASDVAGVLSAEAIARAWCGERRRPVWRVVPRDHRPRDADGDPAGFSAASLAALRDLHALGYAIDDLARETVTLACPAL